jgi:hypothetical protein
MTPKAQVNKAMQWLDSSKLLEHMRDRLAHGSEAIFTDERLEMLSNIYVASLRCHFHACP